MTESKAEALEQMKRGRVKTRKVNKKRYLKIHDPKAYEEMCRKQRISKLRRYYRRHKKQMRELMSQRNKLKWALMSPEEKAIAWQKLLEYYNLPEVKQRSYQNALAKNREKTKKRQRRRWKKLIKENPDEAYTKILTTIGALRGTGDRMKTPQKKVDGESKGYMRYLINRQITRDERAKEKAILLKQEAEEADMDIDEYIRKQEIEKEKKQKRIKADDFLRLFFDEEQIEIQERLRELEKKLPTYNPNRETEYELIQKEIKQTMSKISFDHGKTFLDLNEDRDFNIALSKIAKMKVWNAVVDRFEPEAMMRTLEKMPANERKMAATGNNAQSRVIYLAKYLLEAEHDLVL